MTNGIYKAVLPVFLFLAGCTEKADTGLSGDGGSVPLLVAGRLYGYDGTDSGILHGSEHIGVYMEAMIMAASRFFQKMTEGSGQYGHIIHTRRIWKDILSCQCPISHA